MPLNIKLDHDGIGEVLKSSGVRGAIDGIAADVAANVKAADTVRRNGVASSVEVASYTTDRAAAAVTIAHPAGVGMQAKHGTLTQAAGAAGLEVKER